MRRSLSFDLLEQLFLGKFVSVEIFCSKYDISQRQFKSMVDKLNVNLQEYNLSIDLRTNEKIIGDELQIRFFFYVIYSSLIDEERIRIPEFAKVEMDKAVLEIFELTGTEDYSIILKGSLAFAIGYTRLSLGYLLSQKMQINRESPVVPHSEFNKITDRLFGIQSRLLKRKLSNEQDFLYLFFCYNIVVPLERIATMSSSAVEQYIFHELSLTKKWIETYQSFIDFDLNINERMYLSINLSNIHKMLLNFTGNLVLDGERRFSEKMRDVYSDTFVRFDLFLKELEKAFPVEYRANIKDNIYARACYFTLYQDLYRRHNDGLKVLLVSQKNSIRQNYMKERIEKISSVGLTFVPLSYKNPDVVIADFYCNGLPANPNVPTLSILPHFDGTQMKRIDTFLRENRRKKLMEE
jgi:bisphosphoglycerate-dependent phosphoglycerate mutase